MSRGHAQLLAAAGIPGKSPATFVLADGVRIEQNELAANAIVYGSSIRVENNRFTEPPKKAHRSARTYGVLNATVEVLDKNACQERETGPVVTEVDKLFVALPMISDLARVGQLETAVSTTRAKQTRLGREIARVQHFAGADSADLPGLRHRSGLANGLTGTLGDELKHALKPEEPDGNR